MRIGLIIFSDGWGGAESVVHELARSFRAKGHHVTVLLNQEILRYFRDLQGVTVRSVGPLHNDRHMLRSILRPGRDSPEDLVPDQVPLDPHLKNALRVLRHRRVNAVVRDALLEDRVELVSLHLEDTYHLYTRTLHRLGLPVVVTLHSPLLDVSERPLGPVGARRRGTIARTLTSVDGLTYQSDAELSSLEVLRRPLRCRPEQIPNGVDLAAMGRAGQALEGDRFRLVFMGGGRWQKGAVLAVRTLALLARRHDVELHMLGNIPMGHEARQVAKELGVEDRTAFHGFVPAPRAFDYLNSADLVLIPSLSEGFSITAVEAMALGKPIVATNVGGLPTAVRDGRNALLVPPDPAELARSAAALIEDPGRREAMAWANRADAQGCDWSLVSERYLRYFAEVMERAVDPRRTPTGVLAGDS